MTEHELADAVEIIPRRLYWATLSKPLKDTPQSHYFSVDDLLLYLPFCDDFGPLDIGKVYRYCVLLHVKLTDPNLQEKRIIHFCSHDPRRRANAAFLICAFGVAIQGLTAEEAYQPFESVYPQFLPFRDAVSGPCTFNLTILDCLQGLRKAMELGWIHFSTFDLAWYEYYLDPDHGDMNWIIPGKFLAFLGPSGEPFDRDGHPALMPEDYIDIFKRLRLGLIIRLNHADYDRNRFIKYGLKHADLYFPDGTCPKPDIIQTFFYMCENAVGPVAVHCKAGLGRTGTLIGLYAMKHFKFPGRMWIGWNRLCRPGSICGEQQQFLVDMEQGMFQLHDSIKCEFDLARKVQAMSIHDACNGCNGTEQKEDVGQGDRLRNARKLHRNAPLSGEPVVDTLDVGTTVGAGKTTTQGSDVVAYNENMESEKERYKKGSHRSLKGIFK